MRRWRGRRGRRHLHPLLHGPLDRFHGLHLLLLLNYLHGLLRLLLNYLPGLHWLLPWATEVSGEVAAHGVWLAHGVLLEAETVLGLTSEPIANRYAGYHYARHARASGGCMGKEHARVQVYSARQRHATAK